MVPVLRPSIDKKTQRELLQVLDSGWWGQGPKTFEFEKKFAKYVGAKYAVGTCSGTAALDLCFKAHGVRGGEMITSAMTFVADAIVGEWNDMDVTFADIDEKSLCIDPKKVVFHRNTKAVIAVDSHGRLADIKGIREVWRKKFGNKPQPLIIEDAAHAMYVPGVGKDADITIWSFQAVKTMPTGDGGMVTTNDEKIYKKLRTLTWLGVERSTWERAGQKKYSWDYDITQSQGLKAYMIDLVAVIGIGQLRRLEKMNAKRRAIQSMYNAGFKGIKQIKLPQHSHTVQYYTMRCENRDGLADHLAKHGYATSVHFKPLNKMTYWSKAEKRPLEVANRIWLEFLSLPVFYTLKKSQVREIIRLTRQFYGK